MKRRSFTVAAPGPLAQHLRQALSLAEHGVQALIEAGSVYVDGKRVRGAVQLAAGAKVMVVLEESGQSVTRPPTSGVVLTVLYEDDEVIAVDKPWGVVAQPTPGRVGDSLLDLVSARLGFEAGLVHRLDRETSGVTVFGKSKAATSRLAESFREGRAKKEYLAVTGPGLPPKGRIDLPLSKDPSRPGRWRATTKANGIDAVTLYERRRDGATCLVALFPQTGRTHQLRAHLAGIGCPIVGDSLYGGSGEGRCLLHARVLQLDFPGQASLVVEAPIPPDFQPFL